MFFVDGGCFNSVDSSFVLVLLLGELMCVLRWVWCVLGCLLCVVWCLWFDLMI